MFFFESCQTPRSYLTSQENYVICEYRGFVPRPTKSYKKYQKFKLGAKTKELLNLSNSQNLSVKTYANWALIEKLKNGYEQIFEKILQDTSRITYVCGCTSSYEKMSSTTYYNYIDSKENFFWSGGQLSEKLKTDQKLYRLDSLVILSNPINNELLGYVLANREYKSLKILDRIVELAFVEEIPEAGAYIKEYINSDTFKSQKIKILGFDRDKLSKFGKELMIEIENISG